MIVIHIFNFKKKRNWQCLQMKLWMIMETKTRANDDTDTLVLVFAFLFQEIPLFYVEYYPFISHQTLCVSKSILKYLRQIVEFWYMHQLSLLPYLVKPSSFSITFMGGVQRGVCFDFYCGCFYVETNVHYCPLNECLG